MDGQKLLESKILIPHIWKDNEQREKLLSELKREEGKLIVLSAAGGYSKTVLMSQYARLPGYICAWYHLDSRDNELYTFVRYLVLSLDKALGGFVFDEKLYLKTDEDSRSHLGQSLIKELEKRLEGMERQKLVLALDNFQVLENSEIFRLLEELLDYTDHRFLMVVGTRGVLPDCFAKYFGCCQDDADVAEHAAIRENNNNDGRKLLEISCFGKFRVVILETGREISWRTRKALELFAYLVDLEGKPVERRVLLETLWPDDAPENEVAMLHNMIYSIRKELSAQPELKNLIQYKAHHYYLDRSRIRVDLDNKKEICRLAEAGKSKELYEQRDELLNHWDVYLKEVEGTWCMARRAYFERTYGKACRILADYCRKKGDFETEASCWSAYMAADRYSEEAVAGLLCCYADMGERNQMRRVFEMAQKIFREEMGIELSPETRRIYEQGLKNRKISINKK